MFFERRPCDEEMCDPPTRPKLPSVLVGGRYSAEANAERAERWRALTALQIRGVSFHSATDAASASDAASDAREARETELGVREANATRGSQVVVSTVSSATPELEPEAATWAKRVPWARGRSHARRDTETNVVASDDDDDDDDADDALVATSVSRVSFPSPEARGFDGDAGPVPSRSPFATTKARATDETRESLSPASVTSVASVSSSFEAERASSAKKNERRGFALGAPRRLFRGDGLDDAPRFGAPEPDEADGTADECVDGFAKTRRSVSVSPRVREATERATIDADERAERTDAPSAPRDSKSRDASPRDCNSGTSGPREDAAVSFARSALFSPPPRTARVVAARPASSAFAEAVEAAEREDERRREDAARFVERSIAVATECSRSRDSRDSDAENADPEAVAVVEATVSSCDETVAKNDREKNAAALAALRRSVERNAPPAPPPVRTRVPPPREDRKQPRATAARATKESRAAASRKKAARASSARDAKRRGDEKTAWEPVKTWPPLPAVEPDEGAVAEEEDETAKAEGAAAKPDGGTSADDASAASSSSVWAAIVAAEGTAEPAEVAAPEAARTMDAAADRPGDPPALAFSRAEMLDVFQETKSTPRAETRDGARASDETTAFGGSDAEATASRRRCERAAAALEDAVRAAVDARAAAAARAPDAAREFDAKMASSARILLGGSLDAERADVNEVADGEEETNVAPTEPTIDPTARVFAVEECFPPNARGPGGSDAARVPRACRWRSASGSSFALEPAVEPAVVEIQSESMERAMALVVERCLAKFGDGIVNAVKASQASSR